MGGEVGGGGGRGRGGAYTISKGIYKVSPPVKIETKRGEHAYFAGPEE